MSVLLKSRGWSNKLYNQNELYHSVGEPRLSALFRDNTLYPVWEHKLNKKTVYGSCFSRNPRLASNLAHRSPVQFIVDQEKIRHHNKIIPVQAEYQYLINFNNRHETIIKNAWGDKNNIYSRSQFHKHASEWDEEFVVGQINNFSDIIKGVVLHYDPNYSLPLNKINDYYDKTREFCKTHWLPLAVNKEIMVIKNNQVLSWVAERLEEMTDEEYEATLIKKKPSKELSELSFS